jgi:hypothetical protein
MDGMLDTARDRPRKSSMACILLRLVQTCVRSDYITRSAVRLDNYVSYAVYVNSFLALYALNSSPATFTHYPSRLNARRSIRREMEQPSSPSALSDVRFAHVEPDAHASPQSAAPYTASNVDSGDNVSIRALYSHGV